MEHVVKINPFRCRMWAEHERLEEHITQESCQAEIESFAEHGQRIPVLGRPVRDDPNCDAELIYGARRLFVARHLNVALDVELREVSDQQAAIALDLENRQRKEVSPYERALCYTHWLRAGLFKSQDEIARALRISASQVSRMLKLARLPSVVVNAFENPLEIREAWGLDLHQAWRDPRRQRAIGECARAIALETPRPSAAKVYERLIGQTLHSRRKQRAGVHDEVIKDDSGRPLFRIRYYRKSVAFMLQTEQLSRESLGNLKALVAETLQAASVQPLAGRDVFPRTPASLPLLSVRRSNALASARRQEFLREAAGARD